MSNLNFADDWIRTAGLWCGKQMLYQLSHNHCPYHLIVLCIGRRTYEQVYIIFCKKMAERRETTSMDMLAAESLTPPLHSSLVQ